MACGCSFSRKKSKGRNKYKKRSRKRSRKSSRKSYRKRKSKVARKSIKRKGSRKRSNKRKKSKKRKFKSVVINRNRMAVSNRLFNNGKSYLGSFGRSGRMFNRYSKYTVGNSFRNSPIGSSPILLERLKSTTKISPKYNYKDKGLTITLPYRPPPPTEQYPPLPQQPYPRRSPVHARTQTSLRSHRPSRRTSKTPRGSTSRRSPRKHRRHQRRN